MKIAKKVELSYASVLAIYTETFSPSSVDHRCAVGKFAQRRSVGGESARFGLSTGHRCIEWIAEGPRTPFKG